MLQSVQFEVADKFVVAFHSSCNSNYLYYPSVSSWCSKRSVMGTWFFLIECKAFGTWRRRKFSSSGRMINTEMNESQGNTCLNISSPRYWNFQFLLMGIRVKITLIIFHELGNRTIRVIKKGLRNLRPRNSSCCLQFSYRSRNTGIFTYISISSSINFNRVLD